MPVVPSPSGLRRHAEELSRLLTATPPPATAYMLPHVEALALTVFRALSHWLDVRALDARLANWTAFDTSGLQQAITLIDNATCDRGLRPTRTDALAWCRNELATLSSQRSVIDERTVASAFSTMNHRLEGALATVSDQWRPDPLIALIKNRLTRSRPNVARRAWSRAKSECTSPAPPGHGYPFQLTPASPIQPAFFAVDEHDTRLLCDRLAKYVGWHRSRLIRQARNVARPLLLPPEVLGLARALSLHSEYDTASASAWDWSIGREIGEIARIRNQAPSASLWRAANDILGLDDTGVILQRFTPVHSSGLSAERELLFHILALLAACEAAIGASHALGECLVRYKLRMEVSASEVLRDLATPKDLQRTEIRLQRDLCRFLLGHGLYAVGTRIGRAETDLVVAESSDLHLIEAKLYPKPPTAGRLNSHFPQVDSYVDILPSPPRTRTLVIFNTSDTLLTAPHASMAGECVLMFINLMHEPPNRRAKRRRFRVVDGEIVIDI